MRFFLLKIREGLVAPSVSQAIYYLSRQLSAAKMITNNLGLCGTALSEDMSGVHAISPMSLIHKLKAKKSANCTSHAPLCTLPPRRLAGVEISQIHTCKTAETTTTA